MKTLVFLLFFPLFAFSQGLKFKFYTTGNGLSNNLVSTFCNDPSSILWIGTWDSLNHYGINKTFYLSSLFFLLLSLPVLLFIIWHLYRKNKFFKKNKKKLEIEIEKSSQTIIQQHEKLLKLQTNQKNDYFEIDKFKTFIHSKFKHPLILVLENIEKADLKQDTKEKIYTPLKVLLNHVLIWGYLENISLLEEFEKSVVQDNKIKEVLFDKKQKSPNENLVENALKIIKEKHAESNFNTEMLSDLLKISRIKCYRAFKDVLQQSPSTVIFRYRIKKALHLLQNREKKLNVSEVSFACGFNDPKYFSKTFKKYYGKSPKKFRDID